MSREKKSVQSINLKIILIPLLLLTAMLNPELCVLCAALSTTAVRKTKDSSLGFEVCYQKPFPPAFASPSLFFKSSLTHPPAVYFNKKAGILFTDDIGVDIYTKKLSSESSEQCIAIPPQAIFTVQNGVQEVFARQQVFYVANTHTSYWAPGRSKLGASLLASFLPQENTLIFLEGDNKELEKYIAEREEDSNAIKVIYLQETGHNMMVTKAALMLYYLLEETHPDIGREANQLIELLRNGNPKVWEELGKKPLSFGAQEIYHQFLPITKKSWDFATHKQVVPEILSNLYKNDNTKSDTLWLWIELISLLRPKLELSKQTEYRQSQINIIKKYYDALDLFIAKVNKKGFNPSHHHVQVFQSETIEFLVSYQNTHWLQTMKTALSNGALNKSSGLCPNVVVILGNKHVDSLKAQLDPLYKSLCDSKKTTAVKLDL